MQLNATNVPNMPVQQPTEPVNNPGFALDQVQQPQQIAEVRPNLGLRSEFVPGVVASWAGTNAVSVGQMIEDERTLSRKDFVKVGSYARNDTDWTRAIASLFVNGDNNHAHIVSGGLYAATGAPIIILKTENFINVPAAEAGAGPQGMSNGAVRYRQYDIYTAASDKDEFQSLVSSQFDEIDQAIGSGIVGGLAFGAIFVIDALTGDLAPLGIQ
jgi:hypothetical protein